MVCDFGEVVISSDVPDLSLPRDSEFALVRSRYPGTWTSSRWSARRVIAIPAAAVQGADTTAASAANTATVRFVN